MRVDRLSLDEIDLPRLALVKELVRVRDGRDHSRWIFRAPAAGGGHYVKLWNPGYHRRDNILRAVERGLYTAATTPGLRAVVMHRGACRGYVMAAGTRSATLDPAFVAAVWEATRASGMFAAQFRRTHVVRLQGGAFTMIDLEAAFPVAEPEPIPIEQADYAALVHALRAGGLSADEVAARAGRVAARPAAGGPAALASLAARRASGVGRRLGRLGRRLAGDRRHLIETT